MRPRGWPFGSPRSIPRALGLPDPELRPGAMGDLVVLDADLAVSAVMRHGKWVRESISDA